jgi:hypothetical protein
VKQGHSHGHRGDSDSKPESGKEMLLWFLGSLLVIVLVLNFIFVFLREEPAEASHQAVRTDTKTLGVTALAERISVRHRTKFSRCRQTWLYFSRVESVRVLPWTDSFPF